MSTLPQSTPMAVRSWQRPLLHAAVVLSGYAVLFTALVFPALWRGNLLLEGGESAIYHYPAIFGSRHLWDPQLFGGYPRMADPQMMNWYPPALLLGLTGAEWLWNPFILSAYVLAAAFAYGLTWRLTGSALGASLAGAVYGMNGLVVFNAHHPTIVHAAAWTPLILWALEELRRDVRRTWIVVLAGAVALSLLAGHTQISFYSLLLAGAYLVFHLRSAPAGRTHTLLASLGGLGCGVALAAVQLLPTAEFVRSSGRQDVNFAFFAAHGVRLSLWPGYLFPFVYGGSPGFVLGWDGPSGPPLPYFGDPANGPGETSAFRGLMTLPLVFVGMWFTRRSRSTWFWVAAAVLAVLFAFGADTPVARLFYQLPGFNRFRVPCRALLIFHLALAVLTAWGVRGLVEWPRRTGLRILGAASLVGCVLLATAWGTVAHQFQTASFFGSETLSPEISAAARSSLPWINAEIGRPLVLFAVGLLAVWVWYLKRGRWSTAALGLALLADSTQAGHFSLLMRIGHVPSGECLRNPPLSLANAREEMARTGERIDARDPFARFSSSSPTRVSTVPANLTALWGVPNASGYSPLELSRLGEIRAAGGLTRRPGIDLFAIRSIARHAPTIEELGIAWCAVDLQGPGLGRAPGLGNSRRRFAVQGAPKVTHLALLSTLGNSVLIPDGEALVEVVVHTDTGDLPPLVLRAGEHVGEACCDRQDVRRHLRHRRPERSLPFPAVDAVGGAFSLHQFLGELPLGGRHRVTGLEFRWLGPTDPVLSLRRITLVNDETGAQHPIVELVHDEALPWETLREGPDCVVARNPWPLRRAWLASRVVTLPGPQVLDIVTGRAALPGSELFVPYETALVEQPVPFEPGKPASDDEVRVTCYSSSRVEIAARTANGALLVLGDVHYPGWQAWLDGERVRIFTTDYVLRGVVVPPGEHRIEFCFRPRSFRMGLTLTGLAGVLLLGLLVRKSPGERGTSVP